MSTNIYRNFPKWEQVKGNLKEKEKICSRCNNKVAYELVYDGDGIGLPGTWTFKYNKTYAYKCPICPRFELVSKESAKALLKSR